MLLVIGVTGHTGKYFLQELVKNKYKEKIRFLIRKENEEAILKDTGLNYETIYGDLENIESLKKACKDIDQILEIYNIRYSLNVLEAAIQNNVKRIIFVHTTGIFSKYKMASEEYKIIEKEVIEKSKNNNIDITILRPTMIYGDICDHNISKFIKMMDKMRIYPMIAGGKAEIQPVNARDLGRAYYQVLINPEKTKNKNYNLSGEKPITIKNMLKLILKYLDKKAIFIPIPMFISITVAYILKILTFGKKDIVEKVLRMKETRIFSNEEARRDFGYTTINFEEGIKEEVRQYKNKPENESKNAIILTTVPSTIEQFNMININLLKEMNYDVYVASNFNTPGNIDKIRLENFKTELKNNDIKMYNIDFSRNPLNINNINAYMQLKKIFNNKKFDIIHCHTPICGAITRLASKKTRKNGTKVIYTAHGFHFYKKAPVKNWIVYYPIEKVLSKYTDCIITINEEDYNLAIKKFNKCKKVELVRGAGIDIEKFDKNLTIKEKNELKEKIKLNCDDFLLLEVGELNKNKNQIMAIEVMKELVKINNSIKLLLVGVGTQEQFYQNKIKEYNLQNNVYILGYRRDIPKLMKISNILLSLSYREGLPVNVMEAMASGLPIIATDCRGNKDLIVNGENGYIININNMNELKEKILFLLKNKNICEQFEINSKKKIKKYGNQEIKDRLKKIYQIKC